MESALQMLVENVFFDLDGTLVDSLPGIEYAIDEALSTTRFRRSARNLRALIGPPIRQILKETAPGVTESELDQLEAGFRSAYDSAGWRKSACYDGALNLLEELRRQGKRLFVVTNKPLHITRQILDLLGLAQHLTGALSRDSKTPPYRSKAEMLRCLIGRYSLETSNCLMVGDTLDDYEGAMGAGMSAVLMGHGYGTSAGHAALPGCHRIKDFEELSLLLIG